MLEDGLFGQESDVNHACLAFGLGTVNYRAFPNNGPLPEAAPKGAVPALNAPADNTPTLNTPKISPTALFQARSTEPLVSLTTASAPLVAAQQGGHATPPQGYATFSLLAQAASGAINFQPQGQQPLLAATLTATTEPAASSARPTAQEAFGLAFAAAYVAAFGQQE